MAATTPTPGQPAAGGPAPGGQPAPGGPAPAGHPAPGAPAAARPGPAQQAASGTGLRLEPRLTDLLRNQLREVAAHTVQAIMEEVPGYREALGGRLGANIETAVQMALAGFLRLAARKRSVDPGAPLGAAIEGAYALGQGEARNGRSADALLSAYRVGARVAWRELSGTAVAQGVPAETIAAFAELVFAYIDELSAASVAGHADELAQNERERERGLHRLAAALAAGAPTDELERYAAQVRWAPPATLTAVLLPQVQVRSVVAVIDPRSLLVEDDVAGLPPGITLLLVPDAHGRGRRAALLRALLERQAVAGPARPWASAHASYRRALRAMPLRTARADEARALDTEEHLVELVLTADSAALADLRERALQPLAGLRPASREKLAATLRSWLLHQGRRDDIADELFVHPQTVRYRVGQLRELYGDRLEDPRTVLELTLALA